MYIGDRSEIRPNRISAFANDFSTTITSRSSFVSFDVVSILSRTEVKPISLMLRNCQAPCPLLQFCSTRCRRQVHEMHQCSTLRRNFVFSIWKEIFIFQGGSLLSPEHKLSCPASLLNFKGTFVLDLHSPLGPLME